MKLYPYSEFDGGEDAADDREAWFLARRAFTDGGSPKADPDYLTPERGVLVERSEPVVVSALVRREDES